MKKEITDARLEALKATGSTFPPIEVLQRNYQTVVLAQNREVKVGVLEDHPGLIGLAVKFRETPEADEGTAVIVVGLGQAEELARRILGIDPPIEQQILEELRALRQEAD